MTTKRQHSRSYYAVRFAVRVAVGSIAVAVPVLAYLLASLWVGAG